MFIVERTLSIKGVKSAFLYLNQINKPQSTIFIYVKQTNTSALVFFQCHHHLPRAGLAAILSPFTDKFSGSNTDLMIFIWKGSMRVIMKYKTAAYEDNWLPSRVLHLLRTIDTKLVAPHKTGLVRFIKGS
jgi:hypothetical protein